MYNCHMDHVVRGCLIKKKNTVLAQVFGKKVADRIASLAGQSRLHSARPMNNVG